MKKGASSGRREAVLKRCSVLLVVVVHVSRAPVLSAVRRAASYCLNKVSKIETGQFNPQMGVYEEKGPSMHWVS